VLLRAGPLALALGFRLWRIDSLPPGFHFDEAFEGLEAWRIATDPAYRPIFIEGNFGVAPLNAYAAALAFRIGSWFGAPPGPALMRTMAAVMGVLGVLAVWLLAEELRRQDRARRLSAAFPWLAAAALAVMRWHVHFSRMGIEPIFVPLEWAAATWLLLRGWRTGGWVNFAVMGVVLAITLYTYQGAWVVPFVVAASALLLLLLERDPAPLARRRWLGLIVGGGIALLLATPLLIYFARHPEMLVLRPSQISVVGATGSPADAGVWANSLATLKMFWPFGATGDLDPRRNIPGAPALPLWLAIPFFAGIVAALRDLRSVADWLPLLGLVGLLSVGIFSEYAPHFHRIVGAAAPVALLCGLGLDWLWRWRPAGWPALRFAGAMLATTLLVAAGVSGARDYFVRWAALPDLYYAFDEGLWQIGQWVADQPEDAPIYLTPRSADHPTLAFAWQTQPHPAPITFDARSIFPVPEGENAQPESYVVISHEDFRGPLILRDVLPQAQGTYTFTDFSQAPYAEVYTRSAGTLPSRPPQVFQREQLGDGLSLLGYDILPESPHPGDMLYVQLHWLADADPQQNWTVFVHLIDPANPDAPPVASRDSLPGGGSLITPRWQPGWRVLDEYQIPLPADLAPGNYVLETGLYDTDGARLPADGTPLRLGTITIHPQP
jgi:hypothetical protein